MNPSNACAARLTLAFATGSFCKTGDDLSLELKRASTRDSLTIALSPVDEETEGTQTNIPVEVKKAYSVEELQTRAMEQNFDSPIQFQKVMEAKLKTKTAYLNLIPHLSVNGVLNIASLNLLGVLKAVGDLVPFLFPTRWIYAKQQKISTEAEFDGWILSKANATEVATGLIYSVLRDQSIVSWVKENQNSITQVRDQIKVKEHAGLLQAGASDDVQSILNSVEVGTIDLEGALKDEKLALALASGFKDYSSITQVQSKLLTPLETMNPISSSDLKANAKVAIQEAYELRQMDALIQISQLGASSRKFQWLDPSGGDPQGSLGFNLIPYLQIGAVETTQLLDEREKLEVGISNAVARTGEAMNLYLNRYRMGKADLEVQNRRIQRHLQNLQTGVNFSMSDLTNSLESKLQAQIKILDAQYAYWIAVEGMNRYLLKGVYAKLPIESGDAEWVVK